MKKNNGRRDTILRYIRVFKGVKLPWILIILAIIASLAAASSEIEVATMTGTIIDASQNAIRGSELISYIRATAVVAVLTVCESYFSRKMEETVNLRIRVKLWKKIMRLPTAFYDKDNGNELVSRVTSDAASPSALVVTIMTCITSVGAVVQSFIRLYDTNEMLANYSLLIVPVILAVFVLYSIFQFKLGVYSTTVIAGSLGYLAERVRNFRLIKSSVSEQIEAKKGSGAFKKMYFAEFISWSMTSMFQIISSFSFIMFIFIVFVLGGQLVRKGELTIGDLTSFYMITSVVSMHLGLLFINSGSIFATVGSMKKISEIMDTPSEPEGGKPVPAVCADIVFDGVSFAYNEERDVVRDVSVRIPMGKVTAVIGGNGAGKTTLFKLISRLYEPKSGKVTFSGDDISEYSLSDWRDRFAYVSQNRPLIGGTVRENITYGLGREVSDEELIEVAKKANCYDCIMEKPNGFDEDVGLGGSNFSGGQGQCISIARAMLKNADYLLLDEATSNLDALSEAQVTEALAKLTENKTTVMIAHSYAATKNADNIIVMKDGCVEAVGSPAELLENNEYYRVFSKTM